jgi:hypothetical protein
MVAGRRPNCAGKILVRLEEAALKVVVTGIFRVYATGRIGNIPINDHEVRLECTQQRYQSILGSIPFARVGQEDQAYTFFHPSAVWK